MSNNRTPPIDLELVEWLEKIFPDRLPDPEKDTTHTIWWNGGRQSVVRKIRMEYDRQQSNLLGAK